MPHTLVKTLVLRSDVTEEEAVTVSLIGFRTDAPAEIRATRHMSAIDGIIGVQLIADLKILKVAPLILHERNPIAIDFLDIRAVDIPRHYLEPGVHGPGHA